MHISTGQYFAKSHCLTYDRRDGLLCYCSIVCFLPGKEDHYPESKHRAGGRRRCRDDKYFIDPEIPMLKKLVMEIKRVGSQPSAKGPEDWFTGAVRIDPLFQPNEARRAAA